MHLVAITRLGTSIEEEAAAQALDQGTTAYEERLKLVAGMPAIVLSTADEERAWALVSRLRTRGHGAVDVNAADIVASSEMISMRRFALEPDALVAEQLPGTRLPWAEISALLRASPRRRSESVSVVEEKKFSLGRALVSGGLIMNKTTKREVSTVNDVIEQVLFVFPRDGTTPWILQERGTNYAGLGAGLAPVAAQNFVKTIEQLRARAPHARFDDRLVKRKDDIDTLAHVLAIAIAAGIA